MKGKYNKVLYICSVDFARIIGCYSFNLLCMIVKSEDGLLLIT
jgi:hypothetical protein